MTMTAELSAFQVRVARGFNPPAETTPGMWLVIGGDEGLTSDQVADASVLPQGEIVPFISQAQYLRDEIGAITRTPLPSSMGGDASSGEALKQREVGLLGKVKKFSIKIGNAWEDVLGLAARLQDQFGLSKAPETMRWYCKWADAQVRNDAGLIANALQVRDDVGEREFLRLVGPVFGYDEVKIDRIMEEKQLEQDGKIAALGGSLGGFGNFQTQ
jgi:hypothetical protein